MATCKLFKEIGTQALTNEDPTHIFEYEKTAWEFIDENNLENECDVAETYYTSKVYLNREELTEGRFIGYCIVMENGDLL